MRALPGSGAFGLRGRIVGVVLVTTVATLLVAALALLGPLETSLKNAEEQTLEKALAKPGNAFRGHDLSKISQPRIRASVLKAQNSLQGRIGGTVLVVARPDSQGHGRVLILPTSQDPSDTDTFDTQAPQIAVKAFLTHKAQTSFGFADGTDDVRAAVPFVNYRRWYVVAVRKPTEEIAGAVAAVRRAFLYAALAGLGLTLILGIPLSGRLVRRLRRLREAALELAHGGPAVVDVPVDNAHDEVGDLARTLAAMQQRLVLQEEARRAFVATASHELRTPLTSLDGMLELLHDDLQDPQPDVEDARALLERARVQSRRLGRLAADLLDLSRIDAEVELRSEPVELSELSRAVLAEFGIGAREREINSRLDGDGRSLWALGDPGAVARILRILLDNALRISPPGSEITVALGRGVAGVTVSVRDHGPGVHPDEREAIFRRFHRGRDTAGEAGFGLGLAIGRELAERMGGELVLDETAEPGATFTLRLPAARARDQDPVPVS
jgi:signal transduction histidine kinase